MITHESNGIYSVREKCRERGFAASERECERTRPTPIIVPFKQHTWHPKSVCVHVCELVWKERKMLNAVCRFARHDKNSFVYIVHRCSVWLALLSRRFERFCAFDRFRWVYVCFEYLHHSANEWWLKRNGAELFRSSSQTIIVIIVFYFIYCSWNGSTKEIAQLACC